MAVEQQSAASSSASSRSNSRSGTSAAQSLREDNEELHVQEPEIVPPGLGAREESLVLKADVPAEPGTSAQATPRLMPVPPLKIPGITTDTLQSRRARTIRTAHSKAKTARAHKIGAKTARAPTRAPFWQALGALTMPETSTIPPSADDHDKRVEEIEARIHKMLGSNSHAQEEDEEAAVGRAGPDTEDIEGLEEERKRVLDKALVKNAASKGFCVMNLYRARKKDGSGTAWAPLHPSFRFVVNAEQQLLIRVERDANYVPGTRRPQTSLEAERAHLHCSETITATWSVKDMYRVERIQGPFQDEELPGCAFSVWVQVGETIRALHLWAPGHEGEALMRDFSRALLIASKRLMYLGIRLGSKGFPDQDTAEEAPVDVSEVLRLGITPRHTIVEMAEKPKELRGLVTSGALSLRGKDAASVWSRGYNTCDDELRLVISRTWKKVDERRKVAEKLRLAGVLTCHDLVDLMECHAPRDAEYLPRWSWFRGQPCLLNYRIDVNGGKLLKTATMETLHKLSLLPIDAEVGYGPAHGHMPVAKESQDLWKLVQALWPNSDKDALDATFMKIQRAGARTVTHLVDLITEEGPPGCLLPMSTFFRGRSCMLNFNIDEMGGKLFISSTLEALYSRAVYQKMFDPAMGSTLLRSQPNISKPKGDRKREKALLQEQAEEERRRLSLANVLETATEESSVQILFEVRKPQKVLQINDDVLHVTFSHDGKLMALARANGVISLVSTSPNLDQWKAVHSADLHHHHGAITFCCFRPVDAEAYLPDYILAAASADGAVTVWNLTSLKRPECIRILEHKGCGVTTCMFSACGRLLASGDVEGCCRLFEVCGWNPLNSKGVAMPAASRPTHDWFATHELLGHRGTVRSITSLSFSVDSSMLASASLDTTVRIWQQQSQGPHSGEWLSSHCVHFPGPVNYIQFAPLGKQVLANCLNDDRAYIWDLESMLNQHDPWRYEVLDCGDDKDEIICTSAAWSRERWWTAIGLAIGTVTIWCAKPHTNSTQVATVSNGNDWVSKCVSFSSDSKYMVCVSQLKPEAVATRRKSAGDKGRVDDELPHSEILIYDLELLAAPYAEELDSIIENQLRPQTTLPSSHEVEVQDIVLAQVQQNSHVWLEEVVAHLEAMMGREALLHFFEPRSTAQSIHEIALERAQRTIALLTNSSRAASSAQPGEREIEIIFRREEAMLAMAEQHSPLRQESLAAKQRQSVEEQARQQQHICMVLEWLLSTSKLFQVVWNSYVFNTGMSLDESVEISCNGRVATKASGIDGNPALIWLNPALPDGASAEVEFLIERWTAGLPEDGLRIGLLQRGMPTRSAHQQRGKASDVSWMYGCGTGMRFHTQGAVRRAETYTKYIAREGDKFAVCVDRERRTMSIKINDESQGVMYEDIPAQGDVRFAVQLMSRHESVRTPEAFVRSSWCSDPRHVEIDALEFKTC